MVAVDDADSSEIQADGDVDVVEVGLAQCGEDPLTGVRVVETGIVRQELLA
jgi:hypothetical protein